MAGDEDERQLTRRLILLSLRAYGVPLSHGGV